MPVRDLVGIKECADNNILETYPVMYNKSEECV